VTSKIKIDGYGHGVVAPYPYPVGAIPRPAVPASPGQHESARKSKRDTQTGMEGTPCGRVPTAEVINPIAEALRSNYR
jgi:hypothetical protein